MRRSKLETFEEILQALVKKPLTVDHLAYQTNIDCTIIDRHLNFLIKNGLVEERNADRTTLYAVTERGTAVFKTLNLQKYLEKISSTLLAIDEAMQTIPIISKQSQKQEKP